MGLAEDGVAIEQSQQKILFLSEWDSKDKNFPDLLKTLMPHVNELKNHAINLVLSNVFFKFTVLPWQANIYSRDDWLGLANHRFRQQYGEFADSLEVKVHLGQYGQSVVACAIERRNHQALLDCANEIGFRWSTMTPLMPKLINHDQRVDDWVMLVEPEHLLLIERASGHYQRISTMRPPFGNESDFIQQMIVRRTLSLSKALQPKHIRIYVSGGMKASHIRKPEQVESTLIFDKKNYPSHASWLVSIR